jgi:putative SOS response-associated peptidase YedK
LRLSETNEKRRQPCYRLAPLCVAASLPTLRSIKLLFNLQRDIPLFAPRSNIAPSQEVPVIVQDEGLNYLKPMKWGLVPAWAPDPSIGARMITARAETITEKPSFRKLLQQRRCLIPADGFYEWRREGNRKVPVWIHLKKKQPFAFAGLWDSWRDVEGEVLHTFRIITTMPNALLRRIHNRMPVMFDALQAKQWLDPHLGTRELEIAAVLAPFPSEQMQAYDVSPLVISQSMTGPSALDPHHIRRIAFCSLYTAGDPVRRISTSSL